jgi:hypothetical protein
VSESEGTTRANLRHGSSLKDDLGDIYAVAEKNREATTAALKVVDDVRAKSDQMLLQFTGFKGDAQLTYKDIESSVKGTSAAVDNGFREMRRLLEGISTTTTASAEALQRYERVMQAVLATLYELRDASSTSHEMHKGFKTMLEQCITSLESIPALTVSKMSPCPYQIGGEMQKRQEQTHERFTRLNDKVIPQLEIAIQEILAEHGYTSAGVKREGFFLFLDTVKNAILGNLVSLLATAVILLAAKYIVSSSSEDAQKIIDAQQRQIQILEKNQPKNQ